MSPEINENGGYYFNLQAGIVFFESSAGFVSWNRKYNEPLTTYCQSSMYQIITYLE
jgi:hypothetical protein